jgi:hypothetical protein
LEILKNEIIILLEGSELDNLSINISSLKESFDAQQDHRQEISTFLNLIDQLSNQEKFNVDENLIFAIHWGGEDVEKSSEYTENFKKWVEKYGEVNFIITFWTSAAATP